MTCNDLIKRSNAHFIKDNAVDFKNDILYTEKNNFRFGNLIDCSGYSFFLKKILGHPLPFRYWVAKIGVFPRITKKSIDRNYFYFQFGEDGFFEDLYPLEDKTLCGYWQYAKNINHSLIKPTKKTLLKKYFPYQENKLNKRAVITNAHVLPIARKNYAFLGDSFGNALSSSAEGIMYVLDSSKLLAESIKMNNMESYQKEWCKSYMGQYIKFLASRLNRYNNPAILKFFKRGFPKNVEVIRKCNPDFFMRIMRHENIDLNKIGVRVPFHYFLFLIYHTISLRLKYSLMGLI